MRWLSILFSLGAFLGAEELPALRFGIPPWQKAQSVDQIREQYQPLLTWIGDKLGRKMVAVGGRSYEDMIDLVARGQIDLAVLSPVSYVQAKAKNPGLDLLLTEVKWNENKTKLVDSYVGHIVVRDDRNDLMSIADLRGKRVAFVNRESSSGWRYPRASLIKAGVDPSRDLTALFLGSHPRVTDAVIAGSVDAGATWDYNLEQAEAKHGKLFRILLTTPPIPNLCLVAEPQISAELRAELKRILPTAPPAIFGSLPMQGYVERPDSFYDVVRALIASEDAPPAPASTKE